MTRLLIFDFDGVIADSEVVANQVLADCITELGTPTTLEDSYRLFMGKRLSDVITAIAEWTGTPVPSDFPQMLKRRELGSFRAGLKPVPGALRFLDRVREHPKCIASSSSPDRLALCLSVLGIEDVFGQNVFSASMVERGKPHPDIFIHAARKMKCDPANAVIIEDSVSGVTAGVAAGATVIGLLAASHMNSDDSPALRQAGAHHIVRNFDDVYAVLEAM